MHCISENPENPENPGNPEITGYPENPEIPGDPENPENPENPEIPGNPENPQNLLLLLWGPAKAFNMPRHIGRFPFGTNRFMWLRLLFA